MTDTNKKKPTKKFSWGNLSIAEWENQSQDGKAFKSFTLSKNLWNSETKQVENTGSISINKKEHFTNILYLLENATKLKTEQKRAGYDVKFTYVEDEKNKDENCKLPKKIKDCFLVKFYKDKTGAEKNQQIQITPIDMDYLRALIRVFEDKMVYYPYEKSNKGNSNGSYAGSFEDNTDSRNYEAEPESEPDYLSEAPTDDDIPF